ncbi:MAG TPA: DUF5667 domain-containing protein [Candidatus Aquicultor sp.]|jgi:hypothetical protein
MDAGIDNILAQCIDDIENNCKTVEECLRVHENLREELEPMLAAVESVRRAGCVKPDERRKREAKEKLLAAVEQKRWEAGIARTPSVSDKKRTGFKLGVLPARTAMVVTLCLALSGGTVAMASSSAPGNPLYPVKRTVERLRITLVRDDLARSKLYLMAAQERVVEINKLKEGDVRRAELATEAERDVELAETSVGSVAFGEATPAKKLQNDCTHFKQENRALFIKVKKTKAKIRTTQGGPASKPLKSIERKGITKGSNGGMHDDNARNGNKNDVGNEAIKRGDDTNNANSNSTKRNDTRNNVIENTGSKQNYGNSSGVTGQHKNQSDTGNEGKNESKDRRGNTSSKKKNTSTKKSRLGGAKTTTTTEETKTTRTTVKHTYVQTQNQSTATIIKNHKDTKRVNGQTATTTTKASEGYSDDR